MDDDRDRLDDVSTRIAEIRAEEAVEKAKKAVAENETANMSAGARAGAEMVSLLIAGTAIGWGVDKLFGTTPVFLIIFVLTGIGLGFYEVYRITQTSAVKAPNPRLQKMEKDATKRAKE